MKRSGWAAFSLWAVVGALFAFALVSMASVGLLVLPAAVVAAVLAALYARGGAEILGLLVGAASIALLVGFLNLDYYAGSCPESPNRFRDAAGRVVRVEGCGGFHPVPWLVAGGVLAASGLTGYGLIRAQGQPER